MYSSLREAVNDLEKNKQLIRIKSEVDGNLQAAEIHRRIFDSGGPAILFEKIKGSPFQAVSNIYGTIERTEFLFRKTLPAVKQIMALKANPALFFKSPLKYLTAPFTAFKALPRRSFLSTPIKYGTTRISLLPQIKSWPMDGGAFVTMPQVCTMPPYEKSIMKSNIGMYRIQLSGNQYVEDNEIGLHYQLHRGIGIHHQAYNQSDAPFRCSVFIGGPPSHAFSAIMPMPEGLSEMTMAGLLGGRRFRYSIDGLGHIMSSDADFVITGTITKDVKKREGPFGDHLGYYSLAHDFPVMQVDNVYHRKDPLWHFSVVGRPPQEDSSFGYLIHELVKDLTAQEFPGVKEIHAVDAAGVHPLLISIGSERYMPFREKVPEEILTIANRILGSGQTSLAKYLMIAADDDDPQLTTKDIGHYFDHFLSRTDWRRDLHFHTKTTIDTLDYSGAGWNAGSKVVMACRGPVLRKLGLEIPRNLDRIPHIDKIKLSRPGVLALQCKWNGYAQAAFEVDDIAKVLAGMELTDYPLIVLCDDADFISKTLNNFLWVTFTRSNPSHDIYGVHSSIEYKHWGCKGPLIIDARIKSHHAPVLETDKETIKQVDALFSKSGALYGLG